MNWPSVSLLAILLLCGVCRICALMHQHQHNRPYVSCASLPIATSSQQHYCQQQQFHHETVHHRRHQSSTLYSTPNSREVDMGIFGSSKNQKRDDDAAAAAAAVNGDVNGESSDDDYDGDDDKPGFVRGIIRRIRGRDGPDSGDDSSSSSSSSNSVLSRSKAIRSKTRSVTKKKKKKKQAPQRVTKQVEQSQSPFLQLAQQAKAKNAAKKRAATNKENKKEEVEESLSWTDRVTGWLSSEEEEGNSRKKEKRRKKAQRESDSNKETSSSSSSNPLSVVQKLFKNKDSNNGNGNSKKRSKDEEEWVTVFPKTRISPGELVPVTVGGIDLLVIASNDGKNRLYCIANSCPHLGTPLELGQLVRLPVEDGPAGASTSSSTASRGGGNSTLTDKKPDSKINGDTATTGSLSWTETQVSSILQQDGCEDCIVCPLHRTAFALESGQVRGEWCPYPPIVGRMVGSVKKPTAAATFGVRLRRGRDVQVRINSPIIVEHDEEGDRPAATMKIDQQRPKQQSKSPPPETKQQKKLS